MTKTDRKKLSSRFLFSIIILVFITPIIYAIGDWGQLDPPNAPSERDGQSMVSTPDGEIILFGGHGPQEDLFNDLFVYRENDFEEVVPVNDPPSARKHDSSWGDDDKLYVYGGLDSNDEVLGDVWYYDKTGNQWHQVTITGDAPENRYLSAAARFDDGTVLIVGGKISENLYTFETWLFNPATGTFTQKADCPYPYDLQRMIVKGDKAYILHLFNNEYKMIYYDKSNDTWTVYLPDMTNPVPGWIAEAAFCDAGENGVFVIGGKLYTPETGWETVNTVWKYEPEEEKWSEFTQLPVKLSHASACYDAAGDRVLLFGGRDEADNPTNLTFEYSFTATALEPEESVPTEFKLKQNFPNPFNPSTKIKFSIVQNSFVNISVYDALGNEVKILLNEYKPAGDYSVNFDGTNLSSGVYYYNVEVNGYAETKKMLLLK